MTLVLLNESECLLSVNNAYVADSRLVEHSVDSVGHFHELGAEGGGDELCVLCVGLFSDHGTDSCAILRVQCGIDLIE